jgi:transposase
MQRLNLVKHLSDEELAAKALATRNIAEASRWMILNLIQIGGIVSAEEVAHCADVSKSRVYAVVQLYNTLGPESIVLKPRGGRRHSLLTIRQEKTLLNALVDQAASGSISTIFDIRGQVCQKVGFTVSNDYIWDLLRRHGWKKQLFSTKEVPRVPECAINEKSRSRTVWLPPTTHIAKVAN